MVGKPFRILLVSGVVMMLLALGLQFAWLQSALERDRYVVNQSIHRSLTQVAFEVQAALGVTTPSQVPIQQLSSDYFVVHVNTPLSATLLEAYLIKTFTENGVLLDFEYGIYDCISEQMMYGSFVNMTGGEGQQNQARQSPSSLEQVAEVDYYFGIHFPSRGPDLSSLPQVFWGSLGITALMAVLLVVSLWTSWRQHTLRQQQQDFMNTLAHSFNTPLTTIGLAAQELARTTAAQDQAYAKAVVTEQERLSRLVRQVLQAARLAASSKLGLQPTDLGPMLDAAASHWRPLLANENPLELNVDQPACARVEPALLADLVDSLLDNVRKYALPGTVHLRLQRTAHAVEMTLANPARPVPAKELSGLVKRFSRGAYSASGSEGFGLGLHLARSAVRRMGGKLSLEQQNGQFLVKVHLQPCTD